VAHLARLEGLDHAGLLDHAADPLVALDAHVLRAWGISGAIVGSSEQKPC
jgi:hypothetical protein